MHLQKLFKASILPLLTSCSQRFSKVPSNKPVMKGSCKGGCKRYFTKKDSIAGISMGIFQIQNTSFLEHLLVLLFLKLTWSLQHIASSLERNFLPL